MNNFLNQLLTLFNFLNNVEWPRPPGDKGNVDDQSKK